MIILGKNPGIVQANANALDQSKEDDCDEFLTASAMQVFEEDLQTPANSMAMEPEKQEEVDDPPEPEVLEENLQQEQHYQSDMQEQMEQDGIEFLAGWVAYKHKSFLAWTANKTR